MSHQITALLLAAWIIGITVLAHGTDWPLADLLALATWALILLGAGARLIGGTLLLLLLGPRR
jgi:hypothetical protein